MFTKPSPVGKHAMSKSCSDQCIAPITIGNVDFTGKLLNIAVTQLQHSEAYSLNFFRQPVAHQR